MRLPLVLLTVVFARTAAAGAQQLATPAGLYFVSDPGPLGTKTVHRLLFLAGTPVHLYEITF